MGYSAESSDTDQLCSQESQDKLKFSSKEYKYPCIICGLAFKRKDSFDRHEFKHTGVRSFQCKHPGCDKNYTNSSHLKRHCRSHMKKEETTKTIKCLVETCSSMFKTQDTLVKHMQTHINEKPYSCGHCDQKFKRKMQVKQHLYQHTGDYPYKCPECAKGFVNIKSFRNHKSTHLKVKLHRCPMCSKDFTKWSDLVSHRKIEHISEYQCRVCLKTFFSKSNLSHHQKIHKPKDEKQVFQCPHDRCPNFYFHEKNLKMHIRAKHEGKKFQCAICERQLLTKQKLLQHLKMHISSLNEVRKEPKSRKSSKLRSDAGVPKVSTAARLADVTVTAEVNKMLVTNMNELVEVEESALLVAEQETVE